MSITIRQFSSHGPCHAIQRRTLAYRFENRTDGLVDYVGCGVDYVGCDQALFQLKCNVINYEEVTLTVIGKAPNNLNLITLNLSFI